MSELTPPQITLGKRGSATRPSDVPLTRAQAAANATDAAALPISNTIATSHGAVPAPPGHFQNIVNGFTADADKFASALEAASTRTDLSHLTLSERWKRSADARDALLTPTSASGTAHETSAEAPAAPIIYVRGSHAPPPLEDRLVYIVTTSDTPGIYCGTFNAPDLISTVVNGIAPRPGIPACKRVKGGIVDAATRCRALGVKPILRGPWIPTEISACDATVCVGDDLSNWKPPPSAADDDSDDEAAPAKHIEYGGNGPPRRLRAGSEPPSGAEFVDYDPNGAEIYALDDTRYIIPPAPPPPVEQRPTPPTGGRASFWLGV